MQFILSHWHCLLPMAGVLVAMVLMRGKSEDSEKTNSQYGESPRRQ
jgi:hypothetical protein